MGKTNALRNKISSFEQLADESILKAWEQMQDYVSACPHHCNNSDYCNSCDVQNG
jgi:hypothetical protein